MSVSDIECSFILGVKEYRGSLIFVKGIHVHSGNYF